jgi:hypothetical protein
MLSVDVEREIARLRSEVASGHPAGPLYTGGEYAERDIMAEEELVTPVSHCVICTLDSSSKIGECCC